MEASGITPENAGQDPTAPDGGALDPASPPVDEPTSGTGQAPAPDEGSDIAPTADEDESPAERARDAAREQAPVASDRNDAIVGDQGYEQQPRRSEGSPSHVDTPIASSAPPPSLQSGVPLAEDRAAGVEPGEDEPEIA